MDARDRAAARDQTGINLVQAMAYELRVPLTHISSAAAMLQSHDFSPGEAAEQLKRIELGSERLLHLLDSLIFAGQIDARQLSLASQPVNVSSLVQEVSKDLFPLAVRHGTDLRMQITAQLQPALAHPPALKHMLYGLVDSIIRTTRSELIEVLIHHRLGNVMLTFRDDGDVLTATSVRRAISRLGHTSEPSAALAGCSGVGLYIASTLTDAMSATLQTYHHHGKRLFSLTLPQSHQLALPV